VDVVSEVLSAVKLKAALFFHAEFSAPWCLSARPAAAYAEFLCPGVAHLVMFHYVISGRAYIQLPDGQRVEFEAGDIVLMPHGSQHLLGNGMPITPVDSLSTFERTLTRELKLVRFGGGGEITRFICGYMACEPRLAEMFLNGLPNLIKVRAIDSPAGEWIQSTLRFTAELTNDTAGMEAVLSRLADALFVEALRRYISELPSDQKGWLAGARDPAVGQAMALLHKDPANPWTVSRLAKHVGLSRTRLAERFRHFLGSPPITYLTEWRLKLGAETLISSQLSVAEIAASIGYASEAAFNRAFKRRFDCPPAQFRRNHGGCFRSVHA
jgi:AraC-like DNA-binding protein